MQQLANGTLVLSHVTKEAEGRYLCEATNGIGAGQSKVVRLTVNGRCWFGIGRVMVGVRLW